MKADDNRIIELVKSLQNGNKSAFEELYKLTSPKAYFVALKICKNEHDAEDILQESYIKVLEKIDTVDTEKNFTSWLYQIVANKSKNLLKAKKPVLFSNEEENEIESLPEESTEFSPEENVDREELRNEVMAAVDELTEEKRACVMMMYFGDMGVSEIAESLEVPVSTVKNRLFTARKDLKNKFEKKGITTLYSTAPLGLIIWAIRETSDAVASAFAASTAYAGVISGITSSSAATISTAATAASSAATASTAVATGTGIGAKFAAFSVAQKIIAGVAATCVIGGSTAGVITVVNNSKERELTTYIEEVTTSPSQLTDYAVNIITTENTTTQTIHTEANITSSVPTATTSKPPNTATSVSVTVNTTQTQKTTSSKTTSTTKRTTTTEKNTTVTKATTTKPTSTTQTTAEETTEESTVDTTTNVTTTTTKATTTSTTTIATSSVTSTAAATTTTTQALPATVIVEVTDMDNNVVATLNLSVPIGTQMTNSYLITLIKEQGYEPQAGIYGDALNSTAESGKTYNLIAEL